MLADSLAYAPFGGSELGTVAAQSFTWSLDAPVDTARAKKLVKELERVAGVIDARFAEETASRTAEGRHSASRLVQTWRRATEEQQADSPASH